jgi:hypothetical protein
MSIPDFEVSGLLPPLLIEGEYAAGFSPYKCTVVQVCERFATSPDRRRILQGLLKFRAAYRAVGIEGFQWLAGSFLEDIEALEGRPPRDIDVATFIRTPDNRPALDIIKGASPELFSPKWVKETYLVDHTYVPLKSPPSDLVAGIRYWYALFTHRRGRVWKGILQVDLGAAGEDTEAAGMLTGES